jgi:hypothetical protein
LKNSHIIRLAQKTVKDIKHAKGSCHNRWHHFSSPARRLDATRIAHEGENIGLAEFQQTKFGEVAVR